MDDAEFLGMLTSEYQGEFCRDYVIAAIRRAFSVLCGVDYSQIYPSDTTQMINKLISYKGIKFWDETAFIIALQDEVGLEFDESCLTLPRFLDTKVFWISIPGSKTLGDWTVRASLRIQERMAKS